MTRINIISPSELTDQHLIAEYREIFMVAGSLKRTLISKSGFVESKVILPLYPTTCFIVSAISRIVKSFIDNGMQSLPNLIWRKPTNSPNKFMGSGMLSPGAYVTLEHEHILVFRKGMKREFKTDQEKLNRSKSAYFW